MEQLLNSNIRMRCVHVYDNKFISYLNDVYSMGRMTDDVYKRYIRSQDKIIAISRMQESNNIDKLIKMNLSNLTFKPVKGLNFFKVFTSNLLYNTIHISNQLHKADFIVTRLPSFLGIYSLILNIFFRKSYFIEVVGDAQEALISSKKNPNKLFKTFVYLFNQLNQYFIRNADGVIYVTKEALQKRYPANGITSYASNVDINVPKKSLTKKDYLKKSMLFKIGVIADYNNHYKGLTEAIKAISLLHDKGYNLSLHILGSGTLLEHYTNLSLEYNVQDAVVFEGRLKNNNEIMEWLGKLDIYIQPSYTEGLPRALIEAMSIGLPAVATNVGGVAELISKEFLVEPYDYNALAEKIHLLLQSQDLRCKAGIFNYNKSKDYDKDVLMKRRFKFWNSCRLIVLEKLANKR